MERAFEDREFAPPFRLLHSLTNVTAKIKIEGLLARLQALKLFYRDIESVERMAEKLKLRQESIQKVLSGGILEEDDVLK